jgi:hypothetical protein
VAATIGKLEEWARQDGAMQGLLSRFRELSRSQIAEDQYDGVAAELVRLDRAISKRRTEVLNNLPPLRGRLCPHLSSGTIIRRLWSVR